MSSQRASLSGHQRLYRTLLLAYPRAFRQVYGADMVQVFGDRLRDERERSGRRASVRVWFLTLLDLFKTAPLQRMEKTMTREAAFAVMFAILLAVAVAASAMGIGGGVLPIGMILLMVAVVGMAMNGAFKRDRRGGGGGAGKLGLRDWWVVVGALAGIAQIVAFTGELVRTPTGDNAFAFAIVCAFGAALVGGALVRRRRRVLGDWLMIIGILPFFGMWWLIWPSVVGLAVLISALIDSTRRPVGVDVGAGEGTEAEVSA